MQFRSYNTLHQQIEKRNNFIQKSNYTEQQMQKLRRFDRLKYQQSGFQRFLVGSEHSLPTQDDKEQPANLHSMLIGTLREEVRQLNGTLHSEILS